MVDESFMDDRRTCAIITTLIYGGWPVTCTTKPGRKFPFIRRPPCSIKQHYGWEPQHTSWNGPQASYTIQLEALHYKALHFFSPERTTITFDCLVQGLQFLIDLLSIQHNEIDSPPPRFPERDQAAQEATRRLARYTEEYPPEDDATDIEDGSTPDNWYGGDAPHSRGDDPAHTRQSTCTLANEPLGSGNVSDVQEETRRLLQPDGCTSASSWKVLL
jgi:hypothetical protein